MVNIICVKWGNRYSHFDVNSLKNMVTKNTTIPFNFICITDDPNGIDSDIEVIQLKNPLHLEKWWNKMYMFDPTFLPKAKYVYFDLDVIIQSNIDEILNYQTKYPCFVYRSWDINDHNSKINSSVISWENEMTEEIWQIFKDNLDLVLLKYYGIDGYINFENFDVEVFPDWFYSYMWGTMEENYTSSGIEYYKYNPKYKICLLNGYHNNIEQNIIIPSPYEMSEFKQFL